MLYQPAITLEVLFMVLVDLAIDESQVQIVHQSKTEACVHKPESHTDSQVVEQVSVWTMSDDAHGPFGMEKEGR